VRFYHNHLPIQGGKKEGVAKEEKRDIPQLEGEESGLKEEKKKKKEKDGGGGGKESRLSPGKIRSIHSTERASEDGREGGER